MQVSHSTTAQVAWTPLWAAPEVFRQERATIKADIWSYGIVLWELATLQNVADFPPLGMAIQVQVPPGMAFLRAAEAMSSPPLHMAPAVHSGDSQCLHAYVRIRLLMPAANACCQCLMASFPNCQR